jgi:hypothetical protein
MENIGLFMEACTGLWRVLQVIFSPDMVLAVLHSRVGYFSALVVFVFVGCVHPSYAEDGRKTCHFVSP